MRRIFLKGLFCIALLFTGNTYAQTLDSTEQEEVRMMRLLDSVDKSIKYEQGKVALKDVAILDVPSNYKFIPADKAQMIIHDIWGNPKSESVLGMIVKSDFSVAKLGEWAFVVRYSEDGYVKDEDADKINYDDLLKDIQKSEEEDNKERVKEGYPPIHLMAWAEKPYYDKEKKVLHWAKKLQFGTDDPQVVLNYDVRVLGRKGILSLNAVGTMDELEDINKNIPAVLQMAAFTDGNQYKDFNPSLDKVAAYTIGGLIAGKLIAKTGILLLLLKNIKLLLLGFFGGFAALRKKIAGWFSRKKKDDDGFYKPVTPTEDTMASEGAATISAPAVDIDSEHNTPTES